MNIKKFLKKLSQMADYQQSPPVEPVIQEPVSQPQTAAPGAVEPGVAQTGPLAPVEQSPNINKSELAEWTPRKGMKRKYYYLQLFNCPEQMKESLMSLGYGYKPKFNNWSKQIKEDNALGVSGELTSLEQQFGVIIDKLAVQRLQEIFGFNENTNTDMGEEATFDDIKKIKFVEEGKQQEVAEGLIKKQLEEMADNLDSESTKEFMAQYLSVKKATSDKVHPYSFLNSMLIGWQNRDINEETGVSLRRSGFIAPASLWKKEFGREVNADAEGMEIFVPKGGKKEMKGAGMASLLTTLGQYNAMNKGQTDLTRDDGIRKFFGFLKSLVAKKRLYQSNYSYLSTLVNKNRDKFKTVKDIQDYLGNKLQNKQTDSYYQNTTFMIKPVIFDLDQTSIIPGQEHKDPKPKMDAVRGMWLGLRNEPDKLIDTMYDALANAATNGILMAGKKIDIRTEDTGAAGGYSSGGAIAIQESSGGERRFRTLVHEAAHEILHWEKDRKETTSAQREIDADATAYIVLNHYGVGTGKESLNYISMITKDKSVVMKRLEPVLKASNAIISAIEKQKGMEYDAAKPKQAASNWYQKFKFAL